MKTLFLSLVVGIQLFSLSAQAIEVITIHPLYREKFMCIQHAEGSLTSLGDALGSDCLIHRMVEVEGRKWLRAYRGDGLANEDWFGYGQDVLAPFDGIVESARPSTALNQPGRHECGTPGHIVFVRNDGARVVYAHVGEIFVQPGMTVASGQSVGTVGNNGCSWSPHIHIGAWKGNQPLEIRFDLSKMVR